MARNGVREIEKVIFVRLTPDIARRIDSYAKKLRKDTGMNVGRQDAVRALLTEILNSKGLR